MEFRNARRRGWEIVGGAAVAFLLGGCGDLPAGPGGPGVPGGEDAGLPPLDRAPVCAFPGEGCACDPGADTIECVLAPIFRNGELVCQHGARVCRDGAWSACENITEYAPLEVQKALGAFASIDPCRPNEYDRTSTPDDADLTDDNSEDVVHTTGPPAGLILTPDPGGGMTVLDMDTDGDGVPDVVDDCPLVFGWRAPCDGTGVDDGFFHILAPGETAIDPLDIVLEVSSADVYLMIDTTNSMTEEIANVRTSLTSGTLTPGCAGGLLGAIQCAIPDAAFGVGQARDYPVNRDNNDNDFPYIHMLDPTTDRTIANAVISAILTEGNYHWPEDTSQALYSMASGIGLGAWLGNRTCANGGFGWPCFRPGTVPIAIVLTDAPFWNGPSYATTDVARRRTALTYPSYTFGSSSTSGTDFIGSRNLPSTPVHSILTNDTAATAMDLGDITNQSLSVIGSNAGTMANDFTGAGNACSGTSPSGPDVFYQFTLTAGRDLTFEVFGDFDPMLYLRTGANAAIACDRDSATITDGDGLAVWDDGARITTSTIPTTTTTTTTSTFNCTWTSGSNLVTNCTLTSGPLPAIGTDLTGSSSGIPAGATLSAINVSSYTLRMSRNASSSGGGRTITAGTSSFTGCTMTNGSPTVTGCTLVGAVPAIGTALTGTGVPGSTNLSTLTPIYRLTMSANATASRTDRTLTATETTVMMLPVPVTGGALDPGTYLLIVDSSSGEGTFQVRITNASAPPGMPEATRATEVPWATTVAALNAAGVKTIGVASCEGGCTDLDTRQNAYETCVTTTDLTSTGGNHCGAAYQRCIGRSWGSVAICTAIFDACRATEISAGRQCQDVEDRACDEAEDECLDQIPDCTQVWEPRCWWSRRRNRWEGCYVDAPGCVDEDDECDEVEDDCQDAADVCTVQATNVCTCMNASGSSTTDASVNFCDETIYDLGQMGIQTGSVRADGTPFVYQISTNGSGLSGVIADAVRELSQYILFDVTASCEDPGNAACTTLFGGATVGSPSPVVAGTPRCGACSGASCTDCTPGTDIPYDVTFQNPVMGGVTPTMVPQVFDFDIVLRDANGTELSRTPVRIVVPPAVNAYPATGFFMQEYDSTYDPVNNVGCMYPDSRADWGLFTYTVDVPAGTSIRFQFRTAAMLADLAAAAPIVLDVTASATGATFDVGAAFETSGIPGVTNSLPFVSVTSILNSGLTRSATPTLQTYTLGFSCVDGG